MKNSERLANRTFSLQWHLTALCEQNCRHCYVRDSKTYQNEFEHPLNTEVCKKVIDDFKLFCREIGAHGHIAFTGGNPFLRNDFFEILRYAAMHNIALTILGNPYSLDEKTLIKLKRIGVKWFQLSIDGMKEKHDFLRKPGSFDATIQAIKDLKRYKIGTTIMFSVSKVNADDLISVMNLVNDLGVDVFTFARVCAIGNGQNLTQEEFTPEEYRNLLLQAYRKETKLKAEGSKTAYNKKDHLWTPLLCELEGADYVKSKDSLIHGGCSIGCRSLAILADGTVYACRRFFSPIGKVPEQRLEEIFVSEKLNWYRDAEFKKCSKCDLLQYCRGCPAVAFGKTGIFGSPDPQCWRKIS